MLCFAGAMFWLAMFSCAMLEMANKIHENINAVPTAFLGITVCALMQKRMPSNIGVVHIRHFSLLRDEAQVMNAFVFFSPLVGALVAFSTSLCLSGEETAMWVRHLQ